MLISSKTYKTVFAGGISIILAYISAKFLAQGNPLVTIPWGIAGIVFGATARNKKEALVLGACIGFVASYAYLWFDNTSSLALSRIILLVFLIFLPSLFGLLCGLFSSWIGWTIRRYFTR